MMVCKISEIWPARCSRTVPRLPNKGWPHRAHQQLPHGALSLLSNSKLADQSRNWVTRFLASSLR